MNYTEIGWPSRLRASKGLIGLSKWDLPACFACFRAALGMSTDCSDLNQLVDRWTNQRQLLGKHCSMQIPLGWGGASASLTSSPFLSLSVANSSSRVLSFSLSLSIDVTLQKWVCSGHKSRPARLIIPDFYDLHFPLGVNSTSPHTMWGAGSVQHFLGPLLRERSLRLSARQPWERSRAAH